MVHCGKYLVIGYIFYVFILQKAVHLANLEGPNFKDFLTRRPQPWWASLNSKPKNLKVFKSSNLATLKLKPSQTEQGNDFVGKYEKLQSELIISSNCNSLLVNYIINLERNTLSNTHYIRREMLEINCFSFNKQC